MRLFYCNFVTVFLNYLWIVDQFSNGFELRTGQNSSNKTTIQDLQTRAKNYYPSKEGFFAGKYFCTCGQPSHKSYLGNEKFSAIENDIPWTATFVHNIGKDIFCTGVLLNNLYILTAANCVSKFKPSEISVVLNEEAILPSEEEIGNLTKYQISKIIIHREFNESPGRYNIALVKLTEPISFFFTLLNPVCLPVKDEEYYDKYIGTTTRWGPKDPFSSRIKNKTSFGGNEQTKLALPLLSNQKCNEILYQFPEDMLCAEYFTSEKLCKVDSGGPLTIKRKDRQHLVGIASWDDECSDAHSPSIYARAGRYVKWILRNTEDAEWCIE